LIVACLRTAYGPVLRTPIFLSNSAQLLRLGQPDAAEEVLLEATRVDKYDPEPWRYLAALRHTRSLAVGGNPDREGFEHAAREMLRRNKRSSLAHREYGDWQLASYRVSGESAQLVLAIEAYRRAAELYPNGSFGHAQLAWALHVAGEPHSAGAEATEALRLDSLNPHREQKLAGLRIFDPALVDLGLDDRDAEQIMRQLRKPE
jgi:predicted Zn-dependent protease